MRLRRYLVIAVLSIIGLPLATYLLVSVISGHFGGSSRYPEQRVTHTLEVLADNPRQWTNLSWEQRMTAALQQQGMTVEIHAPSGRSIFTSAGSSSPPPFANNHSEPAQQMLVIRDGQWIGTVQLWSRPGNPIAALVALAVCALAIVFVSFQIGRNIVKPLESMSRSALQIALGDLDFELESSRATEIRQVGQAFETMGDGLRTAFANQRKLEDERRFFISAIAHDLRTPLFALRGYLDGIAQGIAASPEKLAHYVAVTQQQAAHMERLVSDLFAFTRLEYMEQTLLREPFDLATVATTAIESLTYRARDKAITVEMALADGPLLSSGDPHLIERAISNILDNALRHTPEGGKVTVALEGSATRLSVQFSDTGPGFTKEDLAHLFEPLYRGDEARRASTGGSGLGLTIARRILQAHGGDLIAENAPQGARSLKLGWPASEHSVWLSGPHALTRVRVPPNSMAAAAFAHDLIKHGIAHCYRSVAHR